MSYWVDCVSGSNDSDWPPTLQTACILLSITSVLSCTQFLKPENGASMYLRNIRVILQTYTLLKPRGLSCDQYQRQKP